MARVLKLIATFLLVANFAVACSTHRTVSTDTTQYAYDDRRAGEPATVERHSSTSTETSTNEDGGVLSGTVNVIGEVIALPFRAVGGLIRAIF